MHIHLFLSSSVVMKKIIALAICFILPSTIKAVI